MERKFPLAPPYSHDLQEMLPASQVFLKDSLAIRGRITFKFIQEVHEAKKVGGYSILTSQSSVLTTEPRKSPRERFQVILPNTVAGGRTDPGGAAPSISSCLSAPCQLAGGAQPVPPRSGACSSPAAASPGTCRAPKASCKASEHRNPTPRLKSPALRDRAGGGNPFRPAGRRDPSGPPPGTPKFWHPRSPSR